MKKMIFVLTALLLAAPAMAGLTISCSQKGEYGQGYAAVEISYVATADANIPRGLGLEVTVDSGVTITGVESGSEDPNYWVYPGSIIIDTNDPPSVADDGTPLAEGQGTSSVILEMGSLHWPTGSNDVNSPPLAGMLLILELSGTDCNVAITGNGTRGNVVDYAAAELEEGEDLTYTGCYIAGTCLFDDASVEYNNWLYHDRPVCWCYPRQCRGDADGAKLGPPVWVTLDDLNILRGAINQMEPLDPGDICADFDHVKLGPPVWVTLNDLNILRLYINKMDMPANTVVKCCDSDEDCVADDVTYSFWTGPTI